MVTSWMSMDAPMVPPNAICPECHRGLDEDLIAHVRPKKSSLAKAPQGAVGADHGMPRSAQINGICPVKSSPSKRQEMQSSKATGSSPIVEFTTRVGLVAQGRFRSSVRHRFPWSRAGTRSKGRSKTAVWLSGSSQAFRGTHTCGQMRSSVSDRFQGVNISTTSNSTAQFQLTRVIT